MRWVADKLNNGESVTFKPRGKSMEPRVMDGQEVTVNPVTDLTALQVGAVVLCRVAGRIYLHKILAIDGSRVQIGNNKGGVNGWTSAVYGVAVL
jgi:hypothetical protein